MAPHIVYVTKRESLLIMFLTFSNLTAHYAFLAKCGIRSKKARVAILIKAELEQISIELGVIIKLHNTIITLTGIRCTQLQTVEDATDKTISHISTKFELSTPTCTFNDGQFHRLSILV